MNKYFFKFVHPVFFPISYIVVIPFLIYLFNVDVESDLGTGLILSAMTLGLIQILAIYYSLIKRRASLEMQKNYLMTRRLILFLVIITAFLAGISFTQDYLRYGALITTNNVDELAQPQASIKMKLNETILYSVFLSTFSYLIFLSSQIQYSKASVYCGLAIKQENSLKQASYIRDSIKCYDKFLDEEINHRFRKPEALFSTLIVPHHSKSMTLIGDFSKTFKEKDQLAPMRFLKEISGMEDKEFLTKIDTFTRFEKWILRLMPFVTLGLTIAMNSSHNFFEKD